MSGLLAGTNFYLISLFIGILSGIGISLAYVVPIKIGMSWFPDKKGLITGLRVAGFGFGATLWVKLAGSWGQLIDRYGLSNTFTIYGIIFILMLLVGSQWMVFSDKDSQANKKSRTSLKDSSKASILTKVNFYKIFTTFMFSASAGLMTIGLMKILPEKALIENNPNLTILKAGAIAGTAMAVFFSLANGSGRIIWGWLSDLIGQKNSVVLMTSVQGILIVLFPLLAESESLLYLMSTLIGFNFGGNFSLFPSLTAQLFGVESVGKNYGYVFMAYGLGGIIGPILGGVLGDLRNLNLAFLICGFLCVIASFIAASIDLKN